MKQNIQAIIPSYLFQNGTVKDNRLYIDKLKTVYDLCELDPERMDRDMLIKVYISLQLYGTPLNNNGKNYGYNAKVKIDSIRQLCIDMNMSYQTNNIAKIKEILMILEAIELIKPHNTLDNTYYIASTFENAYKILPKDEPKYYVSLDPEEANYLIKNKISLSVYCLIKSLYRYENNCSKKLLKIITGYSNNKINKAIDDMKSLNIIYWQSKQNLKARYKVNYFEDWSNWNEFEE